MTLYENEPVAAFCAAVERPGPSAGRWEIPTAGHNDVHVAQTKEAMGVPLSKDEQDLLDTTAPAMYVLKSYFLNSPWIHSFSRRVNSLPNSGPGFIPDLMRSFPLIGKSGTSQF